MSYKPPIYNQPVFGNLFGGLFRDAFGGPVIDPLTVANLSLALHADVGVTGDPVSAWADQSTNNNDASQATENRRPVVNATGINGKKSLTWEKTGGQEDYLQISDDATLDLTAGYSTFVVCKPTTYAGFPSLWSKNTNANRFIINTGTPPASGLFAIATGSAQSAQSLTSPGPAILPVIGAPLILEAHFQFTPVKIVRFFSNGVSLGAAPHTLNDIINDAVDMLIGSTIGALAQTFVGEYRAVYIYKGVITDNEILGVRNFLGADSLISVGQDI